MFGNKIRGISTLVLATSIYGFYGIFARLIALEFDVFTQNWVRNLFVLILASVLLILFKQKWKRIAKKDAPWIAAWVTCDVLHVIALFISFNNLTIGTALFLLFAGCTITAYIAGIFLLKEKMTKIKIISILFSIIGLFFIFGEQFYTTQIIFLIIGLFTGITFGLWYIFPKKISEEYPKFQLIILGTGGVFLINIILANIYNQQVPPFSFSLAWLGILLYGIAQFLGDILIIRGTRLVKAHIGSLILPFEAVFGSIFAFLFFNETLNPITILGGLFIITGAIIPHLQKKSP